MIPFGSFLRQMSSHDLTMDLFLFKSRPKGFNLNKGVNQRQRKIMLCIYIWQSRALSAFYVGSRKILLFVLLVQTALCLKFNVDLWERFIESVYESIFSQ